uniref:UbiA prenyltransferase family protein n=1 Tax=Algoriphagus sp. TaxID=1872435 RepID=UPI0040488B99
MLQIIKLLRVQHYIKNLFIFAPLFFSFKFDYSSLISTSFSFLLFSLLASSVYILNDVFDIDEDKKHPSKKNRPLANGSVKITSALILFSLLSFSSLTIAFLFNLDVFSILFIYFILNIAYSFKLKHISIIDIFIIAIGFVLRLFAGANSINLYLSPWIIIMTFLLALFLAIAKRRDDVSLSLLGKETRKNISGYNYEFVNAIMVFMSGVIVVAYILYTLSEEVTLRLGTKFLFLTTFFVILGIFRYMQITFVEKNSGNPIGVLLKDRFLQLTILFWLLSFFVLVRFV